MSSLEDLPLSVCKSYAKSTKYDMIHFDVTLFYRRNRYTAYRQFVRWCWHYLGKEVRVILPSCVVSTIRDTFPDQSYTGFHSDWSGYVYFESQLLCLAFQIRCITEVELEWGAELHLLHSLRILQQDQIPYSSKAVCSLRKRKCQNYYTSKYNEITTFRCTVIILILTISTINTYFSHCVVSFFVFWIYYPIACLAFSSHSLSSQRVLIEVQGS